ncbi:aldehyde dehydrogenase family protein [Frankia sp. QA3]|uniref:aldehyde dehydrogenase family protein n=1 Tax=Frankia sp. QA3 TaxID=710111 RepID=UPI000269BF77|nr:aldehyde dehydrogenase family protein [Frankia sp. QA3]EIV92856.1 NAD-dependent aldehyde dehydrogenase [Frankia sp. QA3]
MTSSLAPADPEIRSLPTGILVGGEWREAASGQTLPDINPVTEEVLADVAAGGEADIDAAVRAARAQFDGGEWSRRSGADRGALLLRLADLIERDADRLARIQSLENGVPTAIARVSDVANAVQTLRYFAGWADKISGTVVPTSGFMGRPTHSYTVREPVGVVGAIIPWNAPLAGAVYKLCPALTVGCTVVLKPAEDALLTVLHLGTLIEEAGFPPGTVNIVPGLGEVAGAALVAHPGVDLISFTGSPDVGRVIQRSAAETFKRTTLELGGKSPQLVFADADIPAAVAGTAMGLFANQGQICAAATRILVERPVYEEFVAGLGAAAAGVRLGDPDAADVDMGPLINRSQLHRVLGYIEVGRMEGARLVAGGGRPEGAGYFVQPTIFADATNDMTIAREEIFGPVGTVIPFDDEAQAVAIGNDSIFGLTATVWTSDLSRAHRVAGRVRAGQVWVNAWGAFHPGLPWGGFKQSGVGRELGLSGLHELTEEKVVTVVL